MKFLFPICVAFLVQDISRHLWSPGEWTTNVDVDGGLQRDDLTCLSLSLFIGIYLRLSYICQK